MSLQIELLEQSFNYIKPYKNLFVTSCYNNLFKANPELESLLTNIAPETKKHQLWDDLVLVIDNLHQPDVLTNVLQGLGAKLFTYGASPEHYPLVRDALFTTFEQFLGGEWTDNFKQAWNDAYVDFRGLMLDGAEQTRKQMATINPIAELEQIMKEKKVVAANEVDSLTEELETPVAELKETVEEEAVAASEVDSLLEELLETPVAELEEIMEPEEEVVAASEVNSLAEEALETSVSESEETVEEEAVAASEVDSLLEELLETPVTELEEMMEPEEEVVAASEVDSLTEELLETPMAELEEMMEPEEEVAAVSEVDSLTEELLETAVAEIGVEDTVEQEDTIVKNIDNYPEKTTMPESDKNISKEDIILEQSQESLEENDLEAPLADLSENLKSPTIDPKFTQIFIPESQSESTASATATAEKPVASEKTYQPESKSSQPNKKLLVGGGFAGIAGIIWLLIILL